MVDTTINLAGVSLKNPVIPASGTFGYGHEFAELYDINCLGSLSFKGTTPEPRFGNATPRIAECPSGLLNAVGLQNPGIEVVISEELPKLRQVFQGPIIGNISGFSIADYVHCAQRLNDEPQVEIIEVNVSCPNVHGGGMSFGTSPTGAAEVAKAVKAVTTKPVFVKLTPNVQNIADIAKACEDAGADGISLINTILGMRIDIKSQKPVLANTMGGLSGGAVLPIALRMVYEVYEAVKIPIIGMGGVSDIEDIFEMMLAGATAVQVGAANLVNPFACRDMVTRLPKIMKRHGIESLQEIIGGAH